MHFVSLEDSKYCWIKKKQQENKYILLYILKKCKISW